MIYRIYAAQKENSSPGDFVNLVQNDLDNIGLQISESELRQMSKQRIKKIVKDKVLRASFTYLVNLQKTHSKMKNINYEKFEMSNYLNSPLFSRNSRTLLLGLRTRTVRGIKCDFPGIYKDRACPVGCGEDDNLPNILTCKVLKQYQKVITFMMGYCDMKIFSSKL